MFSLPYSSIEKIKCIHKRTLYGNLYYDGTARYIRDVKVFNTVNGLNKDLSIMDFISSTDKSWIGVVSKYICNKYNQKSLYEL